MPSCAKILIAVLPGHEPVAGRLRQALADMPKEDTGWGKVVRQGNIQQD